MKIHKKRNTILLIIISCALLLGGCGKEKQTADFSGVTSVCELATLKCYYHNVAKEEIDASGPFAKWFKTGYKKIWTEYSGIIEYGIDVSKVEVSEPDKDGVVTITIPEAEVLNVDVDESSMSKPLTDTGFLTSITKEERKLYPGHRQIWRRWQKRILNYLQKQKHGRRHCLKNM